jgi:hypothetical protein
MALPDIDAPYTKEPLITQPDLSLEDFRDAVGGKGPKAYDWADKPHRLVYDLCREIHALREKLKE